MTIALPWAPSLRTTIRWGYWDKSYALIYSIEIFSYSPSLLIFITLLSSDSFGERKSKFCKSASGISSSLPPQSSITNLPIDLAYIAASVLISKGISFYNNTILLDSMAVLNSLGSSSNLE